MFGDVLKQMTVRICYQECIVFDNKTTKFPKEQNILSFKEVQWGLAKKQIGLCRVIQNTSDERKEQVNKQEKKTIHKTLL